jgi:putative phosphoesterase
MVTLGIVSDSHIPDRTKFLPDGLSAYLSGVDRILHAGDICRKWVLEELEEIAPVTAARGNADWLMPFLPLRRVLNIEDVPIELTHSHGGFTGYLYQWWIYYTRGYDYEFHYQRVCRASSTARIIIFGHTHIPHCRVHGEQLLINPGSLGPTYQFYTKGPSAGKLSIDSGKISAEIVDLTTKSTIYSLLLDKLKGGSSS